MPILRTSKQEHERSQEQSSEKPEFSGEIETVSPDSAVPIPESHQGRERPGKDREKSFKRDIHTASKAKTPATSLQGSASSPLAAQKTERMKRIERILEEDLSDAYRAMDEHHRAMFVRAGEENVRAIDALLGSAKVKVQKIFEIIKSWLRMIPGMNKWFVVQEAKIKTDKIVRLAEQKRQQ